jgi:peroxiredoxin
MLLPKRMLEVASVVAIGVCVIFGSSGGHATEPSARMITESIGTEVADFELEDYRGRLHQLSEYDEKVVVLAFLGCDCPLVKLYTATLEQLAQDWAKHGVVILGINSNSHDSLAEMGAFARRHNISFLLLKDGGNRVADAVLAQRTPEVLVLDSKRRIRFRGRINDQYGIGYIRDEAEHNYLATAVKRILGGGTVETTVVEPVGCHIGRVRDPDPNSKVTYHRDIAPILQKRCIECHRAGEIAPFELAEYEEVAGWSAMIEEVIAEGRMPPWHASEGKVKFQNDRSMPQAEKQLIYDWVAAGAPAGEPTPVKETLTWTKGWQLPANPDFVANISAQPIRVKAEGEIRYQNYSIDPQFKEDKWIRGVEIQPGNRAVVHHVLMFAGDNRSVARRFNGGATGFDGGYVPGQRAVTYPVGYAKRISAGSQLFFQVHYTPIGSEQTDQTRVGLLFADSSEVKFEVRTSSAVNPRFRIPPGDADYEVEATSQRLPANAELLLLSPHMHLRGKEFYYQAILPDGSKSQLLDVPNFDFNWQTAYRLIEPMSLPAGTRIHCRAVFDNSADNLNNPDPDRTVRWGDQTWDEMMIGYYDYAVPIGDSDDEVPVKVRAYFERLDKNGDGVVLESELEPRVRALFKRFDTDSNGKVDLREFAKQAETL